MPQLMPQFGKGVETNPTIAAILHFLGMQATFIGAESGRVRLCLVTLTYEPSARPSKRRRTSCSSPTGSPARAEPQVLTVSPLASALLLNSYQFPLIRTDAPNRAYRWT